MQGNLGTSIRTHETVNNAIKTRVGATLILMGTAVTIGTHARCDLWGDRRSAAIFGDRRFPDDLCVPGNLDPGLSDRLAGALLFFASARMVPGRRLFDARTTVFVHRPAGTPDSPGQHHCNQLHRPNHAIYAFGHARSARARLCAHRTRERAERPDRRGPACVSECAAADRDAHWRERPGTDRWGDFYRVDFRLARDRSFATRVESKRATIPVIVGVTFVLAIVTLLANLATDVAYALVDPRIRLD